MKWDQPSHIALCLKYTVKSSFLSFDVLNSLIKNKLGLSKAPLEFSGCLRVKSKRIYFFVSFRLVFKFSWMSQAINFNHLSQNPKTKNAANQNQLICQDGF